MSKLSEGKWRIGHPAGGGIGRSSDDDRYNANNIYDAETGECIVQLYGLYQHRTLEEMQDDASKRPAIAKAMKQAHLIKAAPDLQEALRNLVTEIRAYSSPECDDEGSPGADVLKAADAALALSEGK